MPDLQQQQAEFTRHIRNPGEVAMPAGIETRRMKIYDDLIYNNIEGFISGGFPVLRSLYREEDWHRLVRRFLVDYRCSSPYFLEISQEFINWLMSAYTMTPVDPPFMLELAHYEWVELALDVAEDELPAADTDFDPVEEAPVLSPLAWVLSYQYPVHQIGPGVEPDQAPREPTFLIVYRNREERVVFLETNAATARLLGMVRANERGLTGRQLLEALAREMNTDSITPVVEFGANQLREFSALAIVQRFPVSE